MKIFLSYTSADRDWALWIGVVLRDAGHEMFVHEWEIGAGENIPEWMERRLGEADKMIGVFSPAYVTAIHSNSERWAAYWKDPGGRNGFLVPIEVESLAEWPLFAKGLSRLSLVGKSETDAARDLVAFLVRPTPPTTKPPFPGGPKTSPTGGAATIAAYRGTTASFDALSTPTPPAASFSAGGTALPDEALAFPRDVTATEDAFREPMGKSAAAPANSTSPTADASPTAVSGVASPAGPVIHALRKPEGAIPAPSEAIPFHDFETFERWLESRPLDLIVKLAVRSALRVAPVLVDLAPLSGRPKTTMMLLPLFRGMAASWAAARFPSRRNVLGCDAAARGAEVAARDANIAADAAASSAATDFETYTALANTASADAASSAAVAASCVLYASPGAREAAAGAVSYAVRAAARTIAARAESRAHTDIALQLRDDSVARSWTQLAADANFANSRASPRKLLDRPLWTVPVSNRIEVKRQELVATLRHRAGGWDHWIVWLDDRFAGRPADEEKEVARLTLPEEMWEEGARSVEGVKAVNAEIARRLAEIDERRAREAAAADLVEPDAEAPPPPVPLAESGVRFGFGSTGLHLEPSVADVGANLETQTKLHARLRGLVAQLLEQSERASNHHPGMAALVREYASLVDVPFGEIDPIDLWAVGTGLQGFATAYDPGAARRTMSGPLEPEHYAKLVQVARVHAGFVLGFEEVERTAQRGVRFAHENAEIVAEIAEPQGRLLHDLAGQSEWIDEPARELISAIDVAYMQFGWKVAETGYAAFGALKNGLLEVSKALVVIDDLFTGLVGKTLRKGIDAEKILAFAAACFLRDHAADILAFARPLPDLRDWFLYVIGHLEARSRGTGTGN